MTLIQGTILVLSPDYNLHETLMRDGGSKYIFDPQRFNAVVDDLRPRYSAYIDALSEHYGRNVDWWVSSVSSRNVYQSFSFLNLAYLMYVDELVAEGVQIDLILCTSNGLRKAIRKLLMKRGVAIKTVLSKSRRLKNRLRNSFLQHPVRTLRFLRDSFKRFIAAKVTAIGEKHDPSERYLNLLDIFVSEKSFHEGRFVDRYYTGFLEMDHSNQWTYLPTFYDVRHFLAIFRSLRRSTNDFLIKEDYLKLSDYMWALLHVIRLVRLKKYYHSFEQYDVYAIFHEDLIHNLTTTSFESLLNYRLMERLKRAGIKVSLLVNWFENQNLDKALNLGFHEHYKKKSIGYQGFIVSPNQLNTWPTPFEKQMGVIPDVIAVTGDSSSDFLKSMVPDLRIIKSPAFRFKHIWSNGGPVNSSEKVVLVALPMISSDALEILTRIKRIVNKLPRDIEINIKIHPVTEMASILSFLSANKLDSFAVRSEPFSQCLRASSLVVSTASTVILESLAMGAPVIVMGSQSQITYNPIPTDVDKRVWSLCYTDSELISSILFFANADADKRIEFKRIGQDIRSKFFEPVNDKGVYNFVRDLQNCAESID